MEGEALLELHFHRMSETCRNEHAIQGEHSSPYLQKIHEDPYHKEDHIQARRQIPSYQNIDNCLISLSFLKEWIIFKKGDISGNGHL